jgi:hypothetical protein
MTGYDAGRDAALGIFWHHSPQAAQHAEGPLAGLTLAVKDNLDVAGMPTTAGFAAYAGRIAAQDAPAVAGLRRAGVVILGKVAMHEGALGATTDVPRLCQSRASATTRCATASRRAGLPAGRGRRSRRASPISPSAPTRWAPSASRPPIAGWSG